MKHWIVSLWDHVKRWIVAVARWSGIDAVKKWLESIQAVATIAGIIIGAAWTYKLFFVQREGFVHATFEEKITHVPLTEHVNLVQVILRLENTGHSLITVTHATVRIERVLPILGCAPNEQCIAEDLNAALDSIPRIADRFVWPMIASRDNTVRQPIEPGEKAILDFEFTVPASVEVARIYGFIQNDAISEKRSGSVGWNDAVLYDLRKSKSSEVTK